jgi:protein-L-isoaspartate O-methyltransferase
MGGAVSSGETNDQLVDNLCLERYIVTPKVEEVFRKIDRKDYMIFTEDADELEAYEDHAWRYGNLHLSAPCIYTKVMESLQLDDGHSFLNIGSGTGYLSTMVGLIIGAKGINHGIELYNDTVEFAYERLKAFKETSKWYDPVTFCEPYFLTGNGLLMGTSGMYYDRIYCGADCSTSHIHIFKNLLNKDGILILPNGNCLLSITRIGECEWNEEIILSGLSFAPLILPSSICNDMTELIITTNASSLKCLSRMAILFNMGRERYHHISSLPLPPHLLQYLSINETWDEPHRQEDAIKLMCPLPDPPMMDDNPEDEDEDGSLREDDDDVIDFNISRVNLAFITVQDGGLGRRYFVVEAGHILNNEDNAAGPNEHQI